MSSRLRLVASVSVAVLVVVAGSGAAATTPSPGGAGCLRGHWVANQAETLRVVRALIPTFNFDLRSKLYMQFRDGIYQYGTTSIIIRVPVNKGVATARARFFTLAPYTARPGVFTLGRGQSTVEYGEMTATKRGKTVTVKGPPTTTTAVPGGPVPFQCSGNTLRVRLPRFASLDWITLARG